MDRGRRGLLAALLALLVPARPAGAQPVMNPPPGVDARTINTPEGAFRSILNGATMRKGRVLLDLPRVAENGHSVGMTVKVESPMTEADHVVQLDLIADKNPVPRVATFFFDPASGRAEVETRLRLNGTQRVTAIARLSDGSFWFDAADVTVNELACLDGG